MMSHARTPSAAVRGRRTWRRRTRAAVVEALRIAVLSSVAFACSCGGRNDAGSGETGKAQGQMAHPPGAAREEQSMPAGGDAPENAGSDEALRASVDLALMAHHVRPGESLAVRLLGTVGPDGSWALDHVDVRRESGRVILEPRLRRVQGDMFIQMVIPLDRTVKLDLGPGEHRITVLRRGPALVDTVVVSTDARRTPPVVELPASSAVRAVSVGSETAVSLTVTARVADGWIDRIEVRDGVAGQVGPWHVPEMVQRAEQGGLRATLTIRRPAGDPARRVEARAIDGQGTISEVASMQLPAL